MTRRARALAVALGLVTLAGCSSNGTFTAASSSTGTTPAASAGTPSSTAPTGPCEVSIGSQLRERVVIGSGGNLELIAGQLPCRGVGIWTSTFALDQDPATDTSPTFVGRYTGGGKLSLRLPAAATACSAAAVFFAVDGLAATDRPVVQQSAAVQARADLRQWPANAMASVPDVAVLGGRASTVLAGTVTGDPSACSAGVHVSTPVATVGDCWLARDTGGGTPTATGSAQPADDQSARFTKVSCDVPHTYEIYWAESLLPQRYAQDTGAVSGGQAGKVPAATWARQLAGTVCGARGAKISYAHDVEAKDVFLEYQWPSMLSWPLATPAAWDRAQVVCLVRWKDGKPSDRHLLHR